MVRDGRDFAFEITSGCLVKLMQTENICMQICLYFQCSLCGVQA